MKESMKEIKGRWIAKMPIFWQKVLKLSMTVGGCATGILSANAAFNLQSVGVAPIIFTICGYVLTACGALGLAAKLTKE